MERKLISLALFCLLIVFTVNQVEARPSYKQGFARSAADAKPEWVGLWKGLIAVQVSSFGNTGILYDLSAFKNHETSRSGVAWGMGAKGIRLDCDGEDGSGIEIPDTEILRVQGDELTIAACVNIDVPDGFGDKIISKGNTSFALEMAAGPTVGFFIYDTTWREVVSNTTIQAGVDYIFHGTFSPSGFLNIYIGGIDDSASSVTATDINDSVGKNIALLGNVDSIFQSMNGNLYWWFMWDRCLTANEVLRHAINPLGMFELRPLVYKAPAAAASTLIQQIIMY